MVTKRGYFPGQIVRLPFMAKVIARARCFSPVLLGHCWINTSSPVGNPGRDRCLSPSARPGFPGALISRLTAMLVFPTARREISAPGKPGLALGDKQIERAHV